MTLPMALPSLIAGGVLAWARALGEFGATIMFAGNFPGVTQTMPLAIYGRFGAGRPACGVAALFRAVGRVAGSAARIAGAG